MKLESYAPQPAELFYVRSQIVLIPQSSIYNSLGNRSC